MENTITISSLDVVGVSITKFSDEGGYQCNVDYKLKDGDGNVITQKSSVRFTDGTPLSLTYAQKADENFVDERILSSESSDLVTAFIQAITKNMEDHEGLTEV